MTEQEQQDERPHGDPLLASAQGRNDGDDGSRHGKPVAPTDGEADEEAEAPSDKQAE